jgi:hypothetical protein
VHLRRSLPIALAAVALPATALLPTPASAATKPARLSVASIGAPAGGAIQAGREFTVTGRIANRGGRSSRALVSLSLRSRLRSPFATIVGAKTMRRVRAGTTQRFTVKARVDEASARLIAGDPLVLVACVRSRRGAEPRCFAASRRLVVAQPASPATPATPARPGGGPAQPAQPAEPAQPAQPAAPTFTPGARSLGDRLFPRIGNGGYDVSRYDLDLDYEPGTRVLNGEATIVAVATQNLSEFSLDLFSVPVFGVLVDGRAATFRQELDKLIVTLPEGIRDAQAFTLAITYGNQMSAYIDPDGSQEGWVPSTGGAFVVNQPVGAMAWFPNNNHPTDKALYDMRVTVPEGSTVIANGRLVSDSTSADGERHTWHWREDSPMASYLTTATNGPFDLTVDTATVPEVPHYYALDSTLNATSQKPVMLAKLQRSPSMLRFFEGLLDVPYPFSSSGGVFDRSGVGYALESQTKPMYATSTTSQTSPGSSVETIAHEIAHQWVGNAVSPATWSDIWLNEGPAEFLSWYWDEKQDGGPTTESLFDDEYARADFDWSMAPAEPTTAADIFAFDPIYQRGAMTMEALRQILGEDRFFDVLGAWISENMDGNVSTAQLVDFFVARGGVDQARLRAFFEQWLYTEYAAGDKPDITPDTF